MTTTRTARTITVEGRPVVEVVVQKQRPNRAHPRGKWYAILRVVDPGDVGEAWGAHGDTSDEAVDNLRTAIRDTVTRIDGYVGLVDAYTRGDYDQ